MSRDGRDSGSANPSKEQVLPSRSFIYPVKSLLTGIRPAQDLPLISHTAASGVGAPSSPELSRWITEEVERAHDITTNPSTLAYDPNETIFPSNTRPRRLEKKFQPISHTSPNFRHFPAESVLPALPSSSSMESSRYPSGSSSVGTRPSSPFHSATSNDPAELYPHQPPSYPVMTHDIFASTSTSLIPDSASIPFNPSELGLVHLGPISSSSSHSSTSSSLHFSSDQVEPSPDCMPDTLERPNTSTLGDDNDLKDSADDGRSHSCAQNSLAVEEPSFTVRFQAMQDEHGHHVVLGREGTLTRCEDEPIRTPGAVQGFGVLIVVDEQDDTLFVRQVSENSTELLGLSPQYLFSLDCFTDTLPESQAGLLWNNVQYLSEPDSQPPDDGHDAPHIFRISGWGAPGTKTTPSDVTDSDEASSEDRRFWTCWCAMHRPPSAMGLNSKLFVMEFELEVDVLNPLYPLVPLPEAMESVSPTSNGPGLESDNFIPGETSNDNSGRTSLASDGTTGTPLSLGGDLGGRTPGPHTSIQPFSPSPFIVETNSLDALATLSSPAGLEGDDTWIPSTEDIVESTTSRSKPLPALERLRRLTRTAPSGLTSAKAKSRRGRIVIIPGDSDMMDVLAIMAQINEQLSKPSDLETFLKVVVGIIKDLTQFHRVLVYQFDERWNGQVVAELVDWGMTHDLYKGLRFPAADIPAQARQLYATNKVRVLYDRDQATARIVVRSKADLEQPLDMTHCHLRAMSPIHLKYLGNMGVRASMSISIMAFGTLWGLVACHSYGPRGMRASLPTRKMLKLLSQSISRNIERLIYARRLRTKKLVNTRASENHPTGYIVSDFDSLLSLFDADFGILVISDGAKILGPNEHGQEILIVAEYLRLKQFRTIQVSQAVTSDYPDLKISTDPDVIAGLMYVPLSSGGKDFIALLRKGQPCNVHWAGKPFKGDGLKVVLEPRKSFKIWTETVTGRSREWTDEQLETAGVLALVYGKFIEVWRQKENALQTNNMTNLLLSNASHEVRTPLNHIINYLEMALNGPLDRETRDNLSQSHSASKNLLFTINDLLDLTRLESGNETSFNEPFNLPAAIEEAINPYRSEAQRRSIDFILDISKSPKEVIGDARKIRTVVGNLTANALKYTTKGSITVCCVPTQESVSLPASQQTVVEIVVADTGCGIQQDKLESIFREFEQVESLEPKTRTEAVGLGLAVVARIVKQLGGQLRVDSKVGQGSHFSVLILLASHARGVNPVSDPSQASPSGSLRLLSRPPSINSGNKIDSLIETISPNHVEPKSLSPQSPPSSEDQRNLEGSFNDSSSKQSGEILEVVGTQVPVRPIKMDENINSSSANARPTATASTELDLSQKRTPSKLRVLIVEDNILNQKLLAKRLKLDGHTVVNTMNGQEGLDAVKADRDFDCILMDLDMPILNGFEATEKIREVEADSPASTLRLSHRLNRRIPIFAVSASLFEQQRDKLSTCGMDGWILKPINFKRLGVILSGVTDVEQRQRDVYRPGCNWESGGWLRDALDF